MIRPNPTAIRTGDAPSELRRYASELEDTGVPMQGFRWIEAAADRIERCETELANLRSQIEFESPNDARTEEDDDTQADSQASEAPSVAPKRFDADAIHFTG